jgi:hypothetical protein
MSVDVASPPTNGWQELASSFASDSATLILRLVVFFIVITIAGCGLHLKMRCWSSVSASASASSRTRPASASDGMLQNEKLPMQSKRAFVTGLIILNMSDFASYSL